MGTIALKSEGLEALSDNPEDLQAELEPLAGPAAGPNGGQIYTDGLTSGRRPSKESIREIQINESPFSAADDRLSFGRIEIFTKPGTKNPRHDVVCLWGPRQELLAPNQGPAVRRDVTRPTERIVTVVVAVLMAPRLSRTVIVTL